MAFVAGGEFARLLGTIGKEVGSTAGKYILSQSVLGAVIRSGIEEGLSGRTILQLYRAAGGRTSDATFWALRRAISATDNYFRGGIGAGKGALESVEKIPGGREGTYRLDFTVYERLEAADGTVVNVAVPRCVLQKSGLDVEGALEEMANRESKYVGELGKTTVIGYELTGIYRYLGK
jgi:hypothetical protein